MTDRDDDLYPAGSQGRRDDDLGAELRPDYETLRQSLMAPSQWDAVQALRQRIAELERERDIAMTQRGGFQLALQDHAVKLDRALAAARDLRAALKPLAEQDCESWGCDLILSHRCAPAIAVSVLARTAWLDAPEEPLARGRTE